MLVTFHFTGAVPRLFIVPLVQKPTPKSLPARGARGDGRIEMDWIARARFAPPSPHGAPGDGRTKMRSLRRRRSHMNTRVLRCGHCSTDNAVAACRHCGRYFVVTQAHVSGQPRTFESKPFGEYPAAEFDTCDFCTAEAVGSNAMQVVQAGLLQQTCADCHTEFLSGHGLWQQRATLG
jgi:hypothetical protein